MLIGLNDDKPSATSRMDLMRQRLDNHQFTNTSTQSAEDLVRWFGALQSQDLPMSLWAIGVRRPSLNQPAVISAINKGEIIRTHVLRPTWHLVAADDMHWMLQLTAQSIKNTLKSRHKQLEIDEPLLHQVYNLFSDSFKDLEFVSRQQLFDRLKSAGIALHDNRGAHFLLLAELDGLLCSGEVSKNETTYCLYEQRIKIKTKLSREEAIHRLTKLYFQSHGPATLEDFCWWSGLKKTEARQGLASWHGDLESIHLETATYYLFSKIQQAPLKDRPILLIPAYDEIIISYADRSALLPTTIQPQVISANGFFRPVIMLNGLVVGLWKIVKQKQSIKLEINWLKTPTNKNIKIILEEISHYGQFLELPVVYTT